MVGVILNLCDLFLVPCSVQRLIPIRTDDCVLVRMFVGLLAGIVVVFFCWLIALGFISWLIADRLIAVFIWLIAGCRSGLRYVICPAVCAEREEKDVM